MEGSPSESEVCEAREPWKCECLVARSWRSPLVGLGIVVVGIPAVPVSEGNKASAGQGRAQRAGGWMGAVVPDLWDHPLSNFRNSCEVASFLLF